MAVATDVNLTLLSRPDPAAERAAVAASQRLRMLRAMTSVVARRGYATTTVADVVAEARVSRKTFYEQFASLHECFIAAYDACIDVLRQQLLAVQDPEVTATERLRQVIAAYVELMSGEPDIARTCLVESYAAGDDTAVRRSRTNAEFASFLAGAHAEMLAQGAPGAALGAIDYEVIVGSVIAAVTSRIHTRDPRPLTELTPHLEQHVLRALGASGPTSDRSGTRGA